MAKHLQGERTPPFPADAENLIALVNFVGDYKERAKWLERASKLIEKNEKLLASIGKASEIEKLHAEATEYKDKVLSEIDRREKKLEKSKEEFEKDMAARRGALAQEQKVAQERTQDMQQRAAKALKVAEDKESAAKEAWAAAKTAQQKAEEDRRRIAELREELRRKSDEATALAKKLSA